VFGASQGGWVAPLAALQSRDIAFVISVSGPGVSPAEVELDRLENDLSMRGFSAAEIQDAVALMNLRYEVARGGEPVEILLAAVERAKEAPWFPYAPLPRTADSWLLAHWSNLPLDYDPAATLAKLRVPVLALFGALDRNVLEPKNAERWRAALEQGGVQDYTLHTFPTANHMLLESRTGADEEYPALQRFVPEYEPILLRWLQQRKMAN
jgi:pimeloyl-ACP methyl ester carboxylesterase